MGLAEFYKQDTQYSQAMYLIFNALNILPEGKKLKTRASLQIMMGNILLDFFQYNSVLLRSGLEDKPQKEIDELAKFVNSQCLVFENSTVKFPVNKIYTNLDEIKELFKMAMTQYRKALEIYVLDGFVSEHVNVTRMMSKMYDIMSTIEPSIAKQYAMHKKRSDMIKMIYDEVSPKHFIGLWRVSQS
jgi:hypothetical protein